MYRLNERETTIAARVAVLSDKIIAPAASAVDRDGRFPREAMDALAAEGFMGLTVPETLGGMGVSVRGTMAVLEQLAQRCGSTAMVYLMHVCGTACYIQQASVDPAGPFAALLGEVAGGRHLSTLAWSEKGSRSHFWAPVGSCRAEGEHVVLDAAKSWVTTAGEADGYVATASSVTGEGVDLYLLRKGDEGLRIAGGWDGMGLRGNCSAPMNLENCHLPSERRIGEAGKALDIMLGVVLPIFQLGCAAIATGLAESTVQQTVAHLTGSRLDHLDSRLADLPTQRARLAQMRIQVDRSRAHIASVLHSVENPDDSTLLGVLESKASAADSARDVTELAMLACGGAAFSKHLEVERCFRDCRAMSVMAPTSDVIREFIGRALVGLPVFG
ncbi:MAG: acyl-CoA/acyl-ACP dehydrogenase [Candidatus Cloacimonetes bacterium]|nr:acyl-CoA/acyl-ACP dehydrogenase [Candidatus Cloacimonadota bacterium]